MVNRLSESSSDYLRQHAHQGVDWWEWSPEALAAATRREVPVLLSIGYASCHWCHVMSHESFDDPDVASFINSHFVPIKVDRQQLPDVDAVFMTATQSMNNGQGGWPMTAFLTPAGLPFFTGTYFPPEPRQGMPSFSQVLQAMADAWRDNRDQLTGSADYIAQTLSGQSDEVAEKAPDLRAAVDNGSFVVQLQPIVDSDGRLERAEALVRWRHPRRQWIQSCGQDDGQCSNRCEEGRYLFHGWFAYIV